MAPQTTAVSAVAAPAANPAVSFQKGAPLPFRTGRPAPALNEAKLAEEASAILVRGMDYYTGPVYEAVVEGYPSSILGGGRYDGLIGRFAGKDIPAVGCSLGFERILSILQARKEGPATVAMPRVLLVNDGRSGGSA